jgi:ATP-dependent DNA helicase DinG
MTSNILNYWPFKDKKPRISQEKVLQWMESLPDNIKYVIAEAPVGTGKSAIGINYSAFIDQSKGNALILTPQKILQRQYEDSFDKDQLFSLYGKANYTCAPKETNCDIGSDLKPRCETCPHKIAYAKARTAPNTVLNYALALILMTSREDSKINKRKVIICDEAHTLEHHLTEFRALQIGEKRCRQFKVAFTVPSNEKEAIDWIKTYYQPAVEREVESLRSVVTEIEDKYVAGDRMDKADSELINRYKEYVTHLELIDSYISEDINHIINNYVLIKDKSFFKFKAVYGKHTFRTTIDLSGERILFISSTILNKDEFCRDLGIDPERTAFISIDSEFDVDNRPVLYIPKAKMSYGWDKADRTHDRTAMIKAVIEILGMHKDQSGIIHTGSFQIAQWLINELDGKIPHRIFHHNPSANLNREDVINQFTENNNAEPAVLISPSITEGLDLYGDKGRFSIFAKVPFPNLGDSWVKRRADISNEWYRRQAMINVIQGSGRVNRAADDWGYTYILDESFGSLYKSMLGKLPKWFVESVQQ